MKKTTFITFVIALFLNTSVWPNFMAGNQLIQSDLSLASSSQVRVSSYPNFPWIFFPAGALLETKTKTIKTGDTQIKPERRFEFPKSNVSFVAPYFPMKPLFPLQMPPMLTLFTENVPGQKRRQGAPGWQQLSYKVSLVF